MKYRVHGICFVPTEAELVVEAENTNDALLQALEAWRKHKTALILSNSSDENSAFDWHPFAEEIKS